MYIRRRYSAGHATTNTIIIFYTFLDTYTIKNIIKKLFLIKSNETVK